MIPVHDITLVKKDRVGPLLKVTLQYHGVAREYAEEEALKLFPGYRILVVFPWNSELMGGD